jgi:molecular chaperone GrpE
VTTAEPDKGTGPGPPEAAPAQEAEPADEPARVTIRDKRRLKVSGKHAAEPVAEAGKHAALPEPVPEAGAAPETGAVSDSGPASRAGAGDPAGGGLGAELEALRVALDERTRDLQRVTAEYANYRKRVERDRTLVNERATANLLSALLPVLDDLDRARDHGELPDGVAAIADQLVATASKFGLTIFGEKGDPFDPNRHEAVAHLTSAEVTEPTCVDVLRRGYLLGDRLLRPAMVAVADPEPTPPPPSS